MILILLLLACPVAHGAEPEFVVLKKGQKAPFDGRLFNSAAVSKLIVENRIKAEQCNIEIEYQQGRTKEEQKYKFALLEAKCQAADERLNDITAIKEDENEELRKLIKPNRGSWWAVGGFAAGILTSIGIMHAVKQGD